MALSMPRTSKRSSKASCADIQVALRHREHMTMTEEMLEQRLRALEARNADLTRKYRLFRNAGLGATALGTLAAVFGMKQATQPTVHRFETIEARDIRVVDENGALRGRIAGGSSGAILALGRGP